MSACGESSGPPQTRQLTLITAPIEAFQTDVGTSGPSRADTRAFTARLEDESGRPAGRLDGSVVITDREGRGREVREYRVGHVQYTLRDGTLAIGGVFVSTPNGSVPVRGGIRRVPLVLATPTEDLTVETDSRKWPAAKRRPPELNLPAS